MQFVESKDIDRKIWDSKISKSSHENIFQYSWYLDSVCENWGAVINQDYTTIVPIAFSKKIGVKQIIQAPFTREYDIIGDDFNWEEVIKYLSSEFKGIHFRNRLSNLFENGQRRVHQYILLNQEYQDKFRTNAKRLIKKSNKTFSYEVDNNIDVLIELFKNTAFQKIDSISDADVLKLSQLMKVASESGFGEMISIKEADTTVGAAFFLKDKTRITLLKSACLNDAKKQGAMFGLINFALAKYQEDYKIFDFGGSNVESVANFYNKFGSEEREYFDYSIDNLPFWFKTLKKIKK